MALTRRSLDLPSDRRFHGACAVSSAQPTRGPRCRVLPGLMLCFLWFDWSGAFERSSPNVRYVRLTRTVPMGRTALAVSRQGPQVEVRWCRQVKPPNQTDSPLPSQLTWEMSLTATGAGLPGKLLSVSDEHLCLLNHFTERPELTYVEEGTVALAGLHYHVEVLISIPGIAMMHGGGDAPGRYHMDTC